MFTGHGAKVLSHEPPLSLDHKKPLRVSTSQSIECLQGHLDPSAFSSDTCGCQASIRVVRRSQPRSL